MTVAVILAGLFPIMWGTGTGSEVMQRIAAPMVGGMISSTILTLVVIPAVYSLWREWQLKRVSGAATEAYDTTTPPELHPAGAAAP
jgi:Cu(I)/Ag(I) efflux system membrane protein CusA/SilA